MLRILRPGQQNAVAFVYTNTHNLGFATMDQEPRPAAQPVR